MVQVSCSKPLCLGLLLDFRSWSWFMNVLGIWKPFFLNYLTWFDIFPQIILKTCLVWWFCQLVLNFALHLASSSIIHELRACILTSKHFQDVEIFLVWIMDPCFYFWCNFEVKVPNYVCMSCCNLFDGQWTWVRPIIGNLMIMLILIVHVSSNHFT